MKTTYEWPKYAQDVKNWIGQMEEMLEVRVEADPVYREKSKNVWKKIGELKELWPNEKDNDIENVQSAFVAQVERISTAYEDWRTNFEENQNEQNSKENLYTKMERNASIAGEIEQIPPGGHRLPPLPYAYNALEPVISEEIMRLHHDEHHRSYVEGLNKAELEMKRARETNDFELIRHWEREAAFHGAGHYLHTMFWNNMIPGGGGKPGGELRKQIDNDFGSFAAFKRHFSEAAKEVQGVGWAILVWSPRSRRLEILQAEFHHLLSQWDVIPLLGLDVWEHAYYLQYKNNREAYVDNFWSIIHWNNVAERFNKAKNLKWEPF